MSKDDRAIDLSRRSVGKLIGSAVTAGGVAASGLVFLSESAVAATTSLSASNVSISSDAGQLQTLTVQPSMDYEWNGLDNSPERIDFYVEARLPDSSGGASSFEEIGTEGETISSDSSASSSAKSYPFQNTVSIFNHSAIESQDFEESGDGWTKETTVGIRVRTVLTDTAGTTYTDTPQASFTVTLTNEEGTVNGGGNANPDGSAR